MKMMPPNPLLMFVLFLSGFILPITAVQAEDNTSLTLGVKLHGVNQGGENRNRGTDFDSTKGGQLALHTAFQQGRFYTGLSFQSGNYTFDNTGPDLHFASGLSLPSDSVTIKHSEADLIAGYFFWEQVSLFLGIKGIEDKWDNMDYKQNFVGFGLGISGVWPIADDWDAYGSLGFLPFGRVEANGTDVGDGKSSALELGAVVHVTDQDRISLGLKFSSQVYNFDSGDQQERRTGGIFLGYSHAFLL